MNLSDLIRCPVLDTSERRIGKLKDLIVTLDAPHPNVVAVIVRVDRGSTLRFPWKDVQEVETTGITLSAIDSTPNEFEAGEKELLLARHVLDSQIIDIRGKRVVRVADVDLVRRSGKLRLAGVDIAIGTVLHRMGLGRRRERLPAHYIDWADLHLTSHRGHEIQLQTTAAGIHRLSADELAAIVKRKPRYKKVLSARRRAPS